MTTLYAPDDRSFPNGPVFAKGDEVDVAVLADALGVDPDVLAADLVDQGWPEARPAKAKPAKTSAAKKKAANTTPDEGDDKKETP